MMKFLFPVLLLICSAGFAQQRVYTDKAVHQLADYYNTGQYKALYDQFAPESKKVLSEEFIVNFYKINLLQPLGRIVAWNYIDEVKTNANYIIKFERGRIGLKIAVSKDQLITYSEWVPLKPEKEIANPRNPASVKTNNPRQTKLQLYLDTLALKYLTDPNNSGLSIGIVNGNTTETYFYGETKKGTNTLPDARSLYEIGSVTKTFTALVLAHAVNEKKIGLNDDIRKYLPGEYPNLNYNGTPITMVNLANHTSGLHRLPDDLATTPGYDPANPYAHYSKEMIYSYLKTVRPDTLPGANMVYSNLGFTVIATILENVYHKPIAELVKQLITDPLKMSSTYFDVPANDKPLLATGYNEVDGKAVPYWNLGAFNGCGGLKSNLTDLLTYLKYNMNSTSPDVLLTHKETSRQAEFSRGLAWLIEPFKGGQNIWHNGGTAGFKSYCGYIKDKKTGVVILSNSSADVDDIALALLSFSLGSPLPLGK